MGRWALHSTTGLITIRKSLKDNGSPEAIFKTDDERTYFEAEIFIHPAFEQREKEGKEFSIISIDHKLVSALDKLFSNQVSIKQKAQPNPIYIQGMSKILIAVLENELNASEIFRIINLTKQSINVKRYLTPLLDLGLLEMTIPDKPNSRFQKYRATNKLKFLYKELFNTVL